MTWLVTGGAGFIGTSLIASLRKQSPDVPIRVLDDLSASRREDLAVVSEFTEASVEAIGPMITGGVELIVGDIRDAAVVNRATAGVEVVVHLAACTGVQPSIEDPRLDCETNVLGTLNCLQAARDAGCRSFVLASSGAPLGEQSPPIHEQKVPRPLSPYGASKLAGEAYCQAFHGSYGLPTIALRFGNVYGPRSARKQSVVAKFIKCALSGEVLHIYGDGAQTRDFIYVDDLVEAVIGAASSGLGGEVFQIATHRETTVVELADRLVAILGEKTGRRPELKHTAPLAGEIRRNFSDISKARQLLGWQPRTDLVQGLSRTVDWFLAHYAPAGTS
jgi:UDP-glucose 4-epimerase